MNKDSKYYSARNALIAADYAAATTTTEEVAKKYSLSVRQVQRIAKELGVVRTLADANRLMAKYKNYEGHKVADKQKRKTLPRGLRYKLISAHPFCSVCGATMGQCPLHIDHIDGNNRNNEESNLQVLCLDCKFGKGYLKKIM